MSILIVGLFFLVLLAFVGYTFSGFASIGLSTDDLGYYCCAAVLESFLPITVVGDIVGD